MTVVGVSYYGYYVEAAQPRPHLTAYLGGGKSEAGLSVGSIMEAGTGEDEGEREPGQRVTVTITGH